MRDVSRVFVPVVLLSIAVLGGGCNQIFGIDETSLAPPRSYACECSCTGGGQTFDVNNEVCLPEALNPGINPDLPSDFQPSADQLQGDCHIRVERNLEQMSRQCVADRIRCTCEARAGLDLSVACDFPCKGEDLAADCSNFDPRNGRGTA